MQRIALIVAASLFAASCGAGVAPVTTSLPQDDQLDALSAARGRWAAAAPGGYTVTHHDRCQGCDPVARTVAVHEGEVLSLSGEVTTVDDVFATIETAIRDGARVEVEYDPDLGYPLTVFIDRDGDGLAEVDLEYRDLEAMPIVETLDQLLAARARWEAQALDSYTYIMRADCTCPEGGTFEVHVVDGWVAEVRPLDQAAADSSLSPGAIDEAFVDLEAWFADADELIDEGFLAIDVRMDPALGYPRWFRIEAADIDSDAFAGRFTIIVTMDLLSPVVPPDGEPGPDPDAGDAASLDIASARWERAGITDYRYVLTVHCECAPETSGPFEVTVENHEVVGAVIRGGRPVATSAVVSIAEAFASIEGAIAAGIDVDVVYHPVVGYPMEVVIDPEAVAVDGGTAFGISEFAPSTQVGYVAGTVLAGPQCPVMQDPPQPGCEDRPVLGALILVGRSTTSGFKPEAVAEDGTFLIGLAPGEYVIAARPIEGYLGTPEPISVTVEAGQIAELQLMFDTGIR